MPAQTINQACASGLQAVALGAQAILLGQSTIVLAGGIESMSRMPYLVDSEDARWGHKMGNFALVDAMYRDGFFCPLSQLIMGQTAEVLARQYGITREESDAFALESQQRARGGDRGGPVHGRDHARAGHGREGQAGRARRSTSIRAPARRSRGCASCRWSSSRSTGRPASSPPARRRASPTAAPRSCSRAKTKRRAGA